jgi:hypothetical protein
VSNTAEPLVLVVFMLPIVFNQCFYFYSEQYEQSVADFNACLKIQTSVLEPEDRLLAETYPFKHLHNYIIVIENEISFIKKKKKLNIMLIINYVIS